MEMILIGFYKAWMSLIPLRRLASIYENSFNKNKLGHSMSKQGSGARKKKDKLVNFVCYCVNPNHYHFLLEQAVDNGIEKFMQRLGNGYTKFLIINI